MRMPQEGVKKALLLVAILCFSAVKPTGGDANFDCDRSRGRDVLFD
jgi:hypothetical protein